MTHLSMSRRPSAGPRALVIVTAAIILLCIALIYARHGSHPSYLFFFFLPVAAAAVVLGAWVGLIMAGLSVVGTLLPSLWVGLDQVLAGFEQGETTAIIVVWAVFLLAVAWVVGWVSERGGSLSLTQGLGGRAIRAIEEERRRTGPAPRGSCESLRLFHWIILLSVRRRSHKFYAFMQKLSQLAISAEGFVFGHNHYLFEEGVYGLFKFYYFNEGVEVVFLGGKRYNIGFDLFDLCV